MKCIYFLLFTFSCSIWYSGSRASEIPSDRSLRIAVLQAGEAHFRNGNPGFQRNFAVLDSLARAAASSKPDIVVFPEYAISGWPYPDGTEINSIAEPIPGDGQWYRKYVRLAEDIQTPVLGWMLDKDGEGLYSTAFLIDGTGKCVGKYRKVHTNLGEQIRWSWSQGISLEPIGFQGIRYGISICADMFFPETVRAEELMGADVVLHQSISDDMGHIVPVRAMDSGIPIVAAIFRGGSYAVDNEGKLVGKLSSRAAEWRTFEIFPFRMPMEQKYDGLFNPKLGLRNIRRVEAYGILVDPSTRPEWTDVFPGPGGKKQTREDLWNRFQGRYDRRDPVLYHESPIVFDSIWTSPYRVDPAFPHHFVNRENRHLFVLNKTAWAYFGCRTPEAFLRKAREQGITVIRAALEGTPYFSQLGIDLWPWGGTRRNPDWKRMNGNYWDEVERRVRLAGENGIGINLVLYFTLQPDSSRIEEQRSYWEYALLRLGKYANLFAWEIANEHTANEPFQDAVGAYFKKNDIHGRPVCTSNGTTDDAVWPNKPWMDMALVHTCTGSSSPYGLRSWYQAVVRNVRAYGKPAFNNESGREVRHGNDDPIHRRKQGWIWTVSGGFWTWHSREGCEGIDDPAYAGPGAEFLKPMSAFFQSVPFWRLNPNHTAFVIEHQDIVGACLAAPDRSLAVAYVCTSNTGQRIDSPKAVLRLPEGLYEILLLDPVNLQPVRKASVRTHGPERPVSYPLPGFLDDLLVRIKRLSP